MGVASTAVRPAGEPSAYSVGNSRKPRNLSLRHQRPPIGRVESYDGDVCAVTRRAARRPGRPSSSKSVSPMLNSLMGPPSTLEAAPSMDKGRGLLDESEGAPWKCPRRGAPTGVRQGPCASATDPTGQPAFLLEVLLTL